MRVLWVDIDTLRADHLGCYGYARATSPHIDRLASQAVRFTGCYASDVPCLPSRTAFVTGQFGTRNGVVGHGGTAAELFADGASRGFSSRLGRHAFFALVRKAGLYTASLSSFAERHSAYHFLAGVQESATVGKRGLENADEVSALAVDWLERRGAQDDWLLHVQLWDPHTPYRVPAAYGDPFAQTPMPAWLDERVRAEHFGGVGPHSAQEAVGFSTDYPYGDYPRQPRQIESMAAVRRMFDGYDTGVRYADEHVGRLVAVLERLGVRDDVAIVITADHGEGLGELNVYCDHHAADEATARVPMLLCWPGLAPRVERGLCYQVDLAATLIELCGGSVPSSWDGRSFAAALRAATPFGRDELVITQGAWSCQRALRWDRYLCLHTRHDGYHDWPEELLFDLEADPHEQHDLAAREPALVKHARARIERFVETAVTAGNGGVDPLESVLREGGPAHVRGQLQAYLSRLRSTGRAAHAERLEQRHPGAP
jgi:arylsulfatase A-like enzyme